MKINFGHLFGGIVLVANLLTSLAQAQSCGTPTPDGSSGSYNTPCQNLVIYPGTSPSYSNININTTITGVSSPTSDAVTVTSGTLGSLTNSATGVISNSSSGVVDLNNKGTITTLTNAGTIGGSGTSEGASIYNSGTITYLNNSGTIMQVASNGGQAINNLAGATISSINNTGAILSSYAGILNSGTIGTLTNSNLLSGSSIGISNGNTGVISDIQNTGKILGPSGIFNQGTISNITNSGIIGSGNVGITNTGTIVKLLNSQSGLTYQGVVPQTYYVGFSGVNFGTLVGAGSGLTGSGVININPSSWAATKQNYLSSVVSGTGLTSSTFSFAQSGSTYVASNGATYKMSSEYNSSNSTLTLIASCIANCPPIVIIPGIPGTNPAPGGPSGNGSYATQGETQIALQQTRVAVQDVAALQTQSMINGFSYDCQIFDANNICLSAGGRYTNISPDSVNNSSIILVGAYKIDNNIRLGVSIDQNLSASNANGIVNQNNQLPLFGAFAVWNQNPSLVGWGVRANIGYGQKGMDVTRPVITAAQANDISGTASEQGQGSTKVSTFGTQAIGRYGFDIALDTVISPYLGLRYNKSSIDGYTEASSLTVALPLTYSAFGSTATTGIAGGQLDYRSGPWSAWLNLGMEYDMSYSSDFVTVSGFGNVTGGGTYNPDTQKTRFVSGAYGAYDIAKNQRVSLGANFRQTEFSGVNSASIMAFYSMGF
jgi:uncharacterized protein YhjY with autotransporter beta-barrel domain